MDTPDTLTQPISISASRATRARIERLKLKLDTPNASEVIRRALEEFELRWEVEACERGEGGRSTD